MKSVTIFIRAKNEAKEIGNTLEKITNQNRKPTEIIVLDNGSEDLTAKISINHGAKVFNISNKDFTYGRALNKSLELTKSDIIVFLSAHCQPVNEFWLENLIKPIETDNAYVTFGRQIPKPDVNILEEWFTYITFPRSYNKLLNYIGLQQLKFSNANSAVEYSLLNKYQFNEKLYFGEDQEWATHLKKNKIRIEYIANSIVYHSHQFSKGELKKRMRDVGRSIKQKNPNSCLYLPFFISIYKYIVILIDITYCIIKRKSLSINKIYKYRNEYFDGLKEGLYIN